MTTSIWRLLSELLPSQQLPSRASGQTVAAPRVNTESLRAGRVGKRYSDRLEASGGLAPYQWTTVSGETGELPPGMLLDQLGTISGEPRNEGVAQFTVRVTDAKGRKSDKELSLAVTPKLTITSDLSRDPSPTGADANVIADLHAEGGSPPYTWECALGSAPPDGISVTKQGRIRKTSDPRSHGTRRCTVECTDKDGYSEQADFFIKVARAWPLSHRHNSDGNLRIARRSITVRPSLWEKLFHPSNNLVLLGFGIPVVGVLSILAYAFATPFGSTWGYLGIGVLTAFSAFLVGGLVGFLFGVPRLVSSGALRQSGGPQYAPSSNLAEVSDWLTKLLLGAGLVTLTHLGAPISHLIDHVAHGLYIPPASQSAAQAMAGAILFGYTAVGLLDGYVMTTVWYQNWIVRHAGS